MYVQFPCNLLLTYAEIFMLCTCVCIGERSAYRGLQRAAVHWSDRQLCDDSCVELNSGFLQGQHMFLASPSDSILFRIYGE